MNNKYSGSGFISNTLPLAGLSQKQISGPSMSIMTRDKSLPKGIVHGCLVWILAQMPSITNRTEPQFSSHKIMKYLK